MIGQCLSPYAHLMPASCPPHLPHACFLLASCVCPMPNSSASWLPHAHSSAASLPHACLMLATCMSMPAPCLPHLLNDCLMLASFLPHAHLMLAPCPPHLPHAFIRSLLPPLPRSRHPSLTPCLSNPSLHPSLNHSIPPSHLLYPIPPPTPPFHLSALPCSACLLV